MSRLIPLAVLLASTVVSQPPIPQRPGQTRDPGRNAPPAGTAVVRGRVVASDTGQPIRRVLVNLVQTGGPDTDVQQSAAAIRTSSRRATTDDQGRFAFQELPAGYYRLSANPGPYYAQYLSGFYGQKGAGDIGVPFELAEGQQLTNANITLPRAGVITGRLTDDQGEPVARVAMSVLYFAPGSSRPNRAGSTILTDDLGRFRIYGLTPGDYLLMADVRGGPRPDEDDATGLMATYYPGVASDAEAQRIRVRGGAEASGLDFRLLRGRLFTVSGTVVDSQGRPASNVGVMLLRSQSLGSAISSGGGTQADGRFTMRGVAPGDYRLTVRTRPTPAQMAGGPEAAMASAEFASVEVHVDGDVSDLAIVTRPGVVVTGRVVYQEGPPAETPGASPTPIRIAASPLPGEMTGIPMPPTMVAPDLTFTLKGLSGPLVVRAASLPRGFIVKQVLVGTDDITDRAHEFTERDSGQLQVILTSRVSGLQGNVTDDRGQPSLDAFVLLIPEDVDVRHATGNGIYRTGSPDPRGHFQLGNLRGGRYLVIAVPRDRMPRGPQNADAVDELAKDATPVTLGDGEFKVMDLKVSAGG